MEAFVQPLALRSLQVLGRPLWALVFLQVVSRALQTVLERAVPRDFQTSLLKIYKVGTQLCACAMHVEILIDNSQEMLPELNVP